MITDDCLHCMQFLDFSVFFCKNVADQNPSNARNNI